MISIYQNQGQGVLGQGVHGQGVHGQGIHGQGVHGQGVHGHVGLLGYCQLNLDFQRM